MNTKYKKNVRLFIYLLSLLSGASLTLSFAPIYWSVFAFISLVSFFLLLEHSISLKQKLTVGYCYGIGFFSTSVSWIYVSIHAFSDSIFLGILLTAVFIAFLSLFFTIFSLSTHVFCKRPLSKVLLYPVIWIVLELGRTHLFTGFPWVLLGYSQTNSYLSSFASLGSVFLVSFIVCFLSVLVTQSIIKKSNKSYWFSAITLTLIITIAGLLLNQVHWTQPSSKAESVSIIQGNYIQDQKWDPRMLQTIIDHYYISTQKNPAKLIFWPENSIPTYKPFIEPFLHQVNKLGGKQNSAILVGTVALNKQEQYFNSAFVYGNGSGYYYKHHLVPFGEYYPFFWLLAPFMSYFKIPMSSFTKGKEIQPLIDMNGVSVALLICFEVAYPSEVRAQLQHANLIAIISDDAWFGDSLAPWQHEQISQMRAIETGRYAVQATNNGVTSIINAQGEIIKQLPRNKQEVLHGSIYKMYDETPWMRYGFNILFILCFLFLLSNLLFVLYSNCKAAKSALKS